MEFMRFVVAVMIAILISQVVRMLMTRRPLDYTLNPKWITIPPDPPHDEKTEQLMQSLGPVDARD